MSLLPRSLSLRLALAFALVAVVLLGAIGLYLYRSLEREIVWRDDRRCSAGWSACRRCWTTAPASTRCASGRSCTRTCWATATACSGCWMPRGAR